MSNTSIRNKANTDNTAPKPVDSNISNHQQDVPINTHLSITFDEDIKVGNNGFFVISNGLNDTRYIPWVEITGNTITVDPGEDLLSNTQYFVQMSAGAVTDTTGNAVAAVMDTSAFSFTTAVDKTPPKLLGGRPGHHASNVNVSSDISGIFDEPIKIGTGNIIISNGQGDTRTIAVNDLSQVRVGKSGNPNEITINPTQSLLSGSQYYVLVDQDAVTDLAGNPYAGTQDVTASTFTTVGDSSAPFLQRSDPKINAIAFSFNEPIKAGSGVIIITDSQGNQRSIAVHDATQVNITNAAVTITPKDSLTPDTQYLVQIGNGVFTDLAGNAYSGTTSPYTTASSSTPPTVISATPADGASQVALSGRITLKFNEAVTLGTGHFIISNGEGDTRTITGNDYSQVGFALDSMGKNTDWTTIIIDPKQDLLAGSQYSVQMENGAVTNLAGAPVAAIMDSTALNFSTIAKDTTAPIGISSTPSDNAQQVQLGSNITWQFNEPIKIGTGRFILSNGLDDTRIFAANDSKHVYYTNNSDSITIAPRNALLSNSTYTLTVEKDAIVDHQGNAFAGGELHFTTVSTVDTEAPQLSSPLGGTRSINDNITLYFNEPIKIGTGQVILSNGLGDTRTIAIDDQTQVTVNNAGYTKSIVVNPTLPLLANSHYSLQITHGAITDLADNAFAGIQDTTTAQFYTLPNIIKPLELKSVFSQFFYSGNGARHPTNSDIVLYFNENIKAGSGQITITDGQGDTRKIDIHDSNQVKIDHLNADLIINPTLDLLSNHHYSVQLDPGLVISVTGNTFAGITDNTTIQFDTSGKAPGAAVLKPVQEINHGGLQGVYDNKDVLVFNFDTAVTWNGGFNLAQHTFGGNDVVLSADGLSASVELNELSTVTTGDLLTLTGLSDVYGNAGDVLFTL